MFVYIENVRNLQKCVTDCLKDALVNIMRNILNILNYAEYICNNFFLCFGYVRYPESSLFWIINSVNTQKKVQK